MELRALSRTDAGRSPPRPGAGLPAGRVDFVIGLKVEDRRASHQRCLETLRDGVARVGSLAGLPCFLRTEYVMSL